MTKLDVYSDGSCRSVKGGDQPMGCGVYAEVDGKAVFADAYALNSLGTANLAEWHGLLQAIKLAVNYVPLLGEECEVTFHTDSRIVYEQFNGLCALRRQEFRDLKSVCERHASRIKAPYRVVWIPRGRNRAADALASEGRREAIRNHSPK